MKTLSLKPPESDPEPCFPQRRSGAGSQPLASNFGLGFRVQGLGSLGFIGFRVGLRVLGYIVVPLQENPERKTWQKGTAGEPGVRSPYFAQPNVRSLVFEG